MQDLRGGGERGPGTCGGIGDVQGTARIM
jgi:hypothetical protein